MVCVVVWISAYQLEVVWNDYKNRTVARLRDELERLERLNKIKKIQSEHWDKMARLNRIKERKEEE